MIEFIIAIIIGGLAGFYRGGPLKNRDKIVDRIGNKILHKIVYFLVQGDTVFALAFAGWVTFIHASTYHGLSDGIPYYTATAGALILFLYELALSFRGSTPGWGDYIGAAKGTQTTDLAEVSYIDKIIKPFLKRPRLWGVAGLSLRCGEWGLFVGAPILSFWPALVGLMAGPVVYGLSRILPDQYVWRTFEILLGIGLFVAVLR